MAKETNVASIFMAIRASLMRTVIGIVPPKDVEDIVQETYVRVCQAEKQEPIREPRSFLYRTARNLALDQAKKAESRLTRSVEEDPVRGFGETEKDMDETVELVSSHEEFSIFCDAVRHLPVECRRTFVLKKVYGYTQREIATELRLSESTVEKHIATGIERCTYFMLRHGMLDRREGRTATSSTRQGGSA